MTGIDALGGLPTGDYLVRAEPSAVEMRFAELRDDLSSITDELGSTA